LRYKAIPAAVNESNVGKTIIRKYKGDFWDLKNLNKIYLAHQNLFVLRSLSIRRTISPNNGPIFQSVLVLLGGGIQGEWLVVGEGGRRGRGGVVWRMESWGICDTTCARYYTVPVQLHPTQWILISTRCTLNIINYSTFPCAVIKKFIKKIICINTFNISCIVGVML
jgi:hypothetical protein